jgi:hypothetical protein
MLGDVLVLLLIEKLARAEIGIVSPKSDIFNWNDCEMRTFSGLMFL